MVLESGNITLRHFRDNDDQRLAELANNEKIGINLRDGFPFPYRIEDARKFIALFKNHPSYFAIEFNGEYVGNISLVPLENVYRRTAEIGYFLGEPYWNRGIMTHAVNLITDFGFKVLDMVRIHTGVYEYNPASQRVLEKCGYIKEAVFRKNICKNEQMYDEIRFAKIREDLMA